MFDLLFQCNQRNDVNAKALPCTLLQSELYNINKIANSNTLMQTCETVELYYLFTHFKIHLQVVFIFSSILKQA